MTKRLFICYVNVVLASLCGHFVAVLVCGRFGLWPFWFEAILDVRQQNHSLVVEN